jgi:hypothetical protein
MKPSAVILWLLASAVPCAGAAGSSATNAIPIPAGSTAVEGDFARDTDVHWYRFFAAPTLVYTVRVENASLWDHDLSFRVFADGETLAATNSVRHSQQGSAVVWTNTGGARNYYVAVTPFLQFTTGTYAVVVSANDADVDSDGLPDAWEALYFGDPTNAVVTDVNASGVSNGESFATGTDPNDPAGALRLAAIEVTPDSTTLEWPVVPYAAYRVESSTNLQAGIGWVPGERALSGPMDGWLLHIDASGPALVKYFRIAYEMD